MSLFRRNKTWWVHFRVRAQEFHDQLKAELWRVEKLGERRAYTWEECAVAYLRESVHKATYDKIRDHVAKLRTYLGGYKLHEITRDVIERIKEDRLGDGVRPATVNRRLQVLRAMLNVAQDREWIDKAPKVKLLPEPECRPRWITRQQAEDLLAELGKNAPHLAAMVRFSLATGLRQRNVVELEWSQVDLGQRCAWIYADQAKGRRGIAVLLNSEAMAVLREQPRVHERVFTYKGRPVTRVNNHAWRKALARAGIKDFRWHALRSTWASWHRQSGTSLDRLQRLGAWRSGKMVERYAALNAADLADDAERIARSRLCVVTNPAIRRAR
jgi:integrase